MNEKKVEKACLKIMEDITNSIAKNIKKLNPEEYFVVVTHVNSWMIAHCMDSLVNNQYLEEKLRLIDKVADVSKKLIQEREKLRSKKLDS